MLKKMRVSIIILIQGLFLFIINSCSYEQSSLHLGSNFSSTWDFSSTSTYSYNEELIEIVNGRAQLRPLTLEHSDSSLFNLGNHSGSESGPSNTVEMHLNSQSNSPQTKSAAALLPSKKNNLLANWSFSNNLLTYDPANIIGLAIGGLTYENTSNNNQALVFNGVDSLVKLDNSSQLRFTTNDFSISIWFKISSATTANSHKLFTKGGDNTGGKRVEVTIGSTGSREGKLLFILDDNITKFEMMSSQDSYEDNEWHHAVLSFNSTLNEMQMVIDGKIESSTLSTVGLTSIDSIHPATLGTSINHADGSTTSVALGSIDELAIWDTVISEEEAIKLYGAQKTTLAEQTELSPSWTPWWSHIVGYWKFDQDWLDSTKYGHHAIPANNAGLNDNLPIIDPTGKIGAGGAKFDDDVALQYAIVSNTTELENIQEQSFTIQAWYKPESLPDDTTNSNIRHMLIGKSGWHVGLEYRTNGEFSMSWHDSSNTGYYTTSTQTFSPGAFYHVIGTVDAINEKIYLYVNGALQGSTDISGLSIREYGTTPWIIGSSTSNTDSNAYSWFSDGIIDDVALWKTSLSAADVSLIYHRQKQKYAAHFDSKVIDLGSATASWPEFKWFTSFPFFKELIGDFNNDNIAESETNLVYPALTNNLAIGQTDYWNFNHNSLDQISNNDGSLSGNTYYSEGRFNGAITLDGNGDFLDTSGPLSISSTSPFTYSLWALTKTYLGGTVANGSGKYFIDRYGSTTPLVSLKQTATKEFGFQIRYDNGLGIGGPVGGALKLGVWQHIVIQRDIANNLFRLFVDGVEVDTHPDSGDNLTPPQIRIGCHSGSVLCHDGQLDELSIWERALTPEEITQLYRRGANRVKLQVKSCVDAACNCSSYNSSPQGSSTDCDGDGIHNLIDNSDMFKAQYSGPGGDGTTYYSESYNRADSNLSFNCALNTTDSDTSVCAPDEITFHNSPLPTSPEFLSGNYVQLIKPNDNRYAQYRLILEADNNVACSGSPCLPNLESVNLNPSKETLYTSENTEVTPKAYINFKQLLGINIVADNCASFRLSRSSSDYYYNGTIWDIATEEAHRNTQQELKEHILDFAQQHGAGEVRVKAYLKSDVTQSSNCSVSEIDLLYN